MVDVKGLNLSFGDRHVLKNIELHIGDGEVAVIMGSSGGGKTTLLKCIAGLLKPTSGSVAINGTDVIKEPEKARAKTGLVFQYAALFDYLNVKDNILFGVRRQRRLTKSDEEAIVNEQLQNVGLDNVAHLMPDQLSGGMRKRVGLARALCLEPELLLYDEPTSGLDPVTAYSIDALIVETRERTGATSIVVSHDVSSVFRVADKIVFLSKGEIVFDGTPEEFRNSSHDEIADLVGKARSETLA